MSARSCLLLIAGIWLSLVVMSSETLSIDTPAAIKKVVGGRQSIQLVDLEAHVTTLASDEYEGRETLTRGAEMARDYIAEQFRSFGLETLPGQGKYAIDFTLYEGGFDSDGTRLSVSRAGKEMIGVTGRDFRPFPFSAGGELDGQVVFAGYGISDPTSGHDDYAGLDVTDKIVLILRHTPNEKDKTAPLTGSNLGFFVRKAENARTHGASAMLLVTDPRHHKDNDDLRLPNSLALRERPNRMNRRGAAQQQFVSMQVTRALAEFLVGGSGHKLLDMQKRIDDGGAASEFSLGKTRAKLAVKPLAATRKVQSQNVLGFLPGSDAKLAKEWIVIGAHYDHVGAYRGEGDTVFNGADDNASGTAGMLELAQAFAGRAQAPKRSIVFVAFCGEEKGLLGSRALVRQKEVLPLERVRFMLNLDMIGRNPDRALAVYGDGYATGLEAIIEQANSDIGLPLRLLGTEYAGNSDHDPFYRNSIPFMFPFTGLHPDYHQLGDHVEKIAFERMEKIVRFTYGIIDSIADSAQTPRYMHRVTWLGVALQTTGAADSAAVEIHQVDAGSRGATIGLRASDRLVKIGDKEMTTLKQVRNALDQVRPGSRVTLHVLRSGAQLSLDVKRSHRGYLGVYPQPVPEEVKKELGLTSDVGLLMARVIPNGPAHESGIRQGDILISIAGEPVNPSKLGGILSRIGAGEKVAITVIRDGERMALQMTLGKRPGGRQ